MRLRFTKTQILGFLREAEAGTPVMDLCWNYCFSRSTFRAWKAKYGIHAGTGRVAGLPRQPPDAALFPPKQEASRRVARPIRSAACTTPISSPRR